MGGGSEFGAVATGRGASGWIAGEGAAVAGGEDAVGVGAAAAGVRGGAVAAVCPPPDGMALGGTVAAGAASLGR